MWLIWKKNDHVKMMILCEFVKKECNLANFTISNGSSYEEILINFKWLTTKIFGLLS